MNFRKQLLIPKYFSSHLIIAYLHHVNLPFAAQHPRSDPIEHVPGLLDVEEGEKDEEEEVEDADAEHDAPHRGVGTGEGAVGEGEDGDDGEEEEDGAHPAPHVHVVHTVVTVFMMQFKM